jgi:hypothetical protein
MATVKNATRCGICGASADKLENGCYQCTAAPGHMADGYVGIWSDLTRPQPDPKAARRMHQEEER